MNHTVLAFAGAFDKLVQACVEAAALAMQAARLKVETYNAGPRLQA